MKKQFLVKNGQVFAQILGATTLKTVEASTVAAEDALNARFPKVLVGAKEYKVSSAEKYQNWMGDEYAKQLKGGRPDQFLIF